MIKFWLSKWVADMLVAVIEFVAIVIVMVLIYFIGNRKK